MVSVAFGEPWLLAQIAHALFGSAKPIIPKGRELAEMCVGHYQAILSFYGQELGIRVARKHLGWYLDEANATPDIRKMCLTTKEPKVVVDCLFQAHDEMAVAAS